MNNKIGMVLEGGAMRGLFSAGVMDVMLEHGLQVDGIIGVSAGAAFGCNYKSNQKGRAIRYNSRFCRDRRYCGLGAWLRTGSLYSADFCYHEVAAVHDVFDAAAFESSPVEYYLVCTDVHTGQPVYRKCEKADYETLEWIRASAAQPVAARPVRIGGRLMLDGGIADSIPLRYFESIGYEKNLVVLTQPEGYVKQPNKAVPLIRAALPRYPRVAEVLEKRHEMYNAATAYVRQREREGAVFVLCPEHPLGVGTVERNSARLWEVYRHGRAVAEKHLEALTAFLTK